MYISNVYLYSQIISKTIINNSDQSRYSNAKEYSKSDYKKQINLQSLKKSFLEHNILAEKKNSWSIFSFKYGKRKT